MNAYEILSALKAASDGKIWATELALLQQSRRVDFWTLEPTASQRFRTSAYEIKISRSDFFRDKADKQSAALIYSDRFWYVTPPGMLQRNELPDWAGLQEWDGEEFSVKKRAPKLERSNPDWEFVASLLRNSGDCRRDVALYKNENAFLRACIKRLEADEKRRAAFAFGRWMRKSDKMKEGRSC